LSLLPVRRQPTVRVHLTRWVEALNFEMHLVQHGVSSWPKKLPWLTLPPTLTLLCFLWCVYWPIYLSSVGALLAATVVEPLELQIRGQQDDE
jgi:hypothetical protein